MTRIWDLLVADLIAWKLFEAVFQDFRWTNGVDLTLGEENGPVVGDYRELLSHFFGCVAQVPPPTD